MLPKHTFATCVVIYSPRMILTPRENGDTDFEPEEELGDVAAAKVKLKKLRDELEKVKKERQEYLDGWQRCKADTINARKEALAATERSAERKLEGLVHELIPALDSFDMAAQSEAWASVSDGFRSGIEHVQNQLLEALRHSGVQRFGKVGEPFEHALHEAVEERDDVAGAPGSILRILQYGYKLNDKVLRPAKVFVKKL